MKNLFMNLGLAMQAVVNFELPDPRPHPTIEGKTMYVDRHGLPAVMVHVIAGQIPSVRTFSGSHALMKKLIERDNENNWKLTATKAIVNITEIDPDPEYGRDFNWNFFEMDPPAETVLAYTKHLGIGKIVPVREKSAVEPTKAGDVPQGNLDEAFEGPTPEETVGDPVDETIVLDESEKTDTPTDEVLETVDEGAESGKGSEKPKKGKK